MRRIIDLEENRAGSSGLANFASIPAATARTVGLVAWRRTSEADDLVSFGPGELLRIREALPRVVVQVYGGSLPGGRRQSR
jgi:hypothetical protein